MKRFTAFLSLIFICLTLVSCTEEKYEPLPSTENEARTVMTVSVYGKTYEVKYELWRALYLTYRDTVHGDGEEYRQKINSLVLERATEIYSVLALCDKLGIDLYSKSVEKQIQDSINADIEGGEESEGYSSYEEYREALKKMYLNDSVLVLLLRYGIGLELIDDYYIGTFDANDIQNGIEIGEITYSREDIKEYYYSNKCVRVLRAHIQADAYYEPIAYAEEVKNKMELAAKSGDAAVAAVIINTGITAPSEVERGYVIARHNLDELYYSKLTDAAFSIDIGEVSDPVLVNYGNGDIIFILYRTEKNDAHFEESYSEIAYVYLTDTVGEIINEVQSELIESVKYTDVLDTIDYSEVSMND